MNLLILDIYTDQLISRLSANYLVVEASISYVEHVHQTLKFSHHVLHEEMHLGNIFSDFVNKNNRFPIIRRRLLHTPQNRENCQN